MAVEIFIRPVRRNVVFRTFLSMLMLHGYVAVPPVIAALLYGDYTLAVTWGCIATVTCFIGKRNILAGGMEMSVPEAMIVTAFSYPLFSVLSALAFLPDAGFVTGLFESVSGYTTTGLSIVELGHASRTFIFFRSYSQWLGGAGIVIISLVVLMEAGPVAFRLYHSEFGQRNLIGNVKSTAKMVLKIYLTITAAGFLLYLTAGMDPHNAFLYSMSTVSTGGFSPHSDSVAHFNSSLISGSVIVVMLAGAIGMPAYFFLRRGDWKSFFDDIQVKWLFMLVIAGGCLLALIQGLSGRGVLNGLFHSVTAITTTGFHTVETRQWHPAMKLISMIFMIIGGCSGSTAGGVKLFRFIILIQLFRWFINTSLLPREAKLPVKMGVIPVSAGGISRVSGFFVFYISIFLITALFLAGGGVTVTDSLFESASALGTVGLSAGVTSYSLSLGGKILLMINMWAGRLEILPVVIIFFPGIWKRNRRKQ